MSKKLKTFSKIYTIAILAATIIVGVIIKILISLTPLQRYAFLLDILVTAIGFYYIGKIWGYYDRVIGE